MLTRGDVDLSSPVDWDHDDNTGLALLLLGLPGVGGSSRWPDLTGRGDGGVVQSGATWVGTSQNQSGLLLPGANDTTGCVTVADPNGRFAGVPTLTVALWTRADNNGANSFGRAITQNDNIGWSIQNNSGVGVQFAVGGTTASYSYPSLVGSGFHRWAMVYDGARIWGGFDGVVVTSLAKTGAIPASSLGVVIGNRTAGARGWGGVITGVRVQPGFAPADVAGWIARDYEWARDPSTDPRLRRLRYPVSLLTGGYELVTSSDAGAGAEFWSIVSALVTAESATSGEVGAIVGRAGTLDSGALAELASLQGALTSTDTGAELIAAQIAAALASFDQGAESRALALAGRLVGNDLGAGLEGVAVRGELVIIDGGAGGETSSGDGPPARPLRRFRVAGRPAALFSIRGRARAKYRVNGYAGASQ